MAPKMKKFDGPRRPPTAPDGPCEPHSVGPSAQTSKKAGFNHAGGGTPAHCDAKRVGEAARGSLKRRYPPKIFPKFFQNAPEVLPRTSQEPPKPFPNQARSTHETKEAPKKRSRAPTKANMASRNAPMAPRRFPKPSKTKALGIPDPIF